ncbi:MAG: FecR domain-containing protein, partial [Gemmatimonadaceae bacterium]|nr:FecR domain-containing protein [Gemmatimonadaceae bacterium]
MASAASIGRVRNASCPITGVHHFLFGDRRMRGTRVLIGTAALLLSGLAAVHAQDQQDPSARVARTSYLQGDVSFRPGTVNDWTSATLNYPLTSGDHLWTDANARAELHVGANAIRLAPETAFEILNLDDNHMQIRLTQGSALIRLRTLDSNDNVEIDTPTGAVTLLRDGTYRVDVSADGATSTVTARNGEAEVMANNQTVDVRSDETALFTQDGASQDLRNAPPMDEYDQWADARDRAED